MKGNFVYNNNIESKNEPILLIRICITKRFNFFHFKDFSKSARGMILFLLATCSYIPILLKNAENPTVI